MEKQKLGKLNKPDKLKIKKKWEKSKIKISTHLRDVIHGYVMSDGYIRNGILTVDQSVKQKRFVLWLYDKFQTIRTCSPIKEVCKIHPRSKVKINSLRFFTRAMLDGFHHMWYQTLIDSSGKKSYRKKLPTNLHCFFNETFISVWYAGDGTKTIGSIGAKFEISAFTVEERLKLQSLFLTKFKIKTLIISSGISKKGNPQWALKVPSQEYKKFRALITKIDLIPTLFPHKLHKK